MAEARKAAVIVTNVDPKATLDLVTEFFEFHGKTKTVALWQGERAFVEYADQGAARSALLFDKANFMGRTIGVVMCGADAAAEQAERPLELHEAQPGSKAAEECEDFEKIDRPPDSLAGIMSSSSNPAPDPQQKTKSAPLPAAQLVAGMTCFQQALAQPINDFRCVLATTVAGFALLAISS